MESHEKCIYRIQGLTCTSCAEKFEKNVKRVAGVIDAKVNFGASKLIIYGKPDLTQLNQAGSFDSLRIYADHDHLIPTATLTWKSTLIQRVCIAVLLLVLAWILATVAPDKGNTIISLYVLSILVGGAKLFLKGIHSLIRLQFDMNTLMTVAIMGAVILGEWKEGATVVILFAISEVLETYSMDKARQSISSLIHLAPKQALILKHGTETETPVDKINIGDLMIVKPGEKLAMDGIIRKGNSFLNEASITGESMPVTKTVGDEVFSGTLNMEGALEIEVTKRVEDTTLAKIIHLVEEAQGERAPSQAFVDRFAKIYTPIILVIASLITIIPPLLFGGNWGEWVYRGLALLVVGCPCALVISTPISIVTSIGSAARNGVLVKGGIYLEEMATLSTIAFDKTGTLTKGLPVITDILPLRGDKKTTLQIIAAIEKNSEHPIASAIARRAEKESIDYSTLHVEHFASITGNGVRATIERTTYYIGNPALFEDLYTAGIPQSTLEQAQQLQHQGKTVMLFGTEEEITAILAAADEIRNSSVQAIHDLHTLGIKKTVVLTGDNHTTAIALQQIIAVSEVQANLLPHQKLAAINALAENGSKVAMVGDGVNDAPALAAASVGIAMGGAGTDTALETADIVLMGDDLLKLPYIIKLSRKTLKIIKQNISFSLALKGTALLLIIPGSLTLWMAITADMGATLIVTLNSLRLIRKK